MTIKSAGEVLIEEARASIDRLRGCVIPIFDVNADDEAELLGSGVLLSVAGATFLCTAKHVIDGNLASTLYFNDGAQLVPLVGDFLASEEHDVAVLKLGVGQAAAMRLYTVLDDAYVANEVQATNARYAEFIGFPETKNRPLRSRNVLRNHVQCNGCTVIEVSATRIRLRFDPRRNVDAKSRQRVNSADPHGMSGGAMFGIPVNDSTVQGRPKPMLVGISTNQPNSKEVFGTNVVIVMAMVRHGYGVELPARFDAGDLRFTLTWISAPKSA